MEGTLDIILIMISHSYKPYIHKKVIPWKSHLINFIFSRQLNLILTQAKVSWKEIYTSTQWHYKEKDDSLMEKFVHSKGQLLVLID